jgi:hypothetical protein
MISSAVIGTCGVISFVGIIPVGVKLTIKSISLASGSSGQM